MKKPNHLLKNTAKGVEKAMSGNGSAPEQVREARQKPTQDSMFPGSPGDLKKPWRKNEKREREKPISGKSRKIEETVQSLFAELAALPKDEQVEEVRLIEGLISNFRTSLERPVPPLPEPNSGYQKFPNLKGDDAYAWLKEHWGVWLRHFNKELDQDYLYQDQLRSLDLALMNRLRSQRNRILSLTNMNIGDIIPIKSKRIDMEINELSDHMREKRRIESAVQYRRSKNEP